MDSRRLAYLQRLGVTVYIPRDAEVNEPPASAQPVLAEEAPAGPPPTALDPEPGRRQPSPPVEHEAATASAPPLPVDGLGWSELETVVGECTRCRLADGRMQAVFGVGDRTADLVLVGEGPGAEEDRRGEPFVGPAGQLLDAMLAAIGRSRESGVYICNIVKCRPPGNRDPRPDEVAACAPYLERQLALLQPKVIVGLGRVAAQCLLATNSPLARLRGRVHNYGEPAVPVWVTYHPAYLLRSPAEKAKAWHDLKRIRAAVESTETV